ncbi:MAG: PAS domain S-box protein [Kiritimatiellae bacterium]|jgi:PAS domain S-box-containing protein|nr:PAS domain S-box protein [Kiritimatiellia bacterium]
MNENGIRYCENQERLQALYRYEILDTEPEELFDEFTRMAASICKVPIAVLNFLDRDRQWFKSEIGLGVRETPLDVSICKHAILEKDLFVIPDTLEDDRTRNNPVVTAHNGLRFYAGAILRTEEGHPIGTLCVLDNTPRALDPEQIHMLKFLARQIMTRLDLQLEQTRFTQAVNSFTETFITLNQSLRLVYLNPAAAEAFSTSPGSEVKGILLTDLPGFDDSHVFVQNCRRALDRQETRIFECVFPTNTRWMEVALYPSVEGLTVCAKDITKRRSDRQRLHLLEACVQALNDLDVITRAEPLDEPGPEIIYINPAFEDLTGYRWEEVIGKNPRLLQGPKTDRKTLDRIRTAISNGESVREEVLNYAKDGKEYWLELEIQPVRDTEGILSYFISIERDVTERKRLQQRMLRAHRLEGLGALASGLAHELNNMLAPVLMAANLLEDSVTNSESKQLVDTIETGVGDAAEVIRTVLA